MTMHYLLDAAVVTSEFAWDLKQSTSVVEWCKDSRAKLGTASREKVLEHLIALQRGSALGPPKPVRSLVIGALSSLLARAPFDAGRAPNSLLFEPAYSGAEVYRDLIEYDLHDHPLSTSVYIGTEDECWRKVSEVDVSPGDVKTLLVLASPGLPTQQELLEKRRRFFEDARILIVGGQVEQAILSALREEFGLSHKAVEWEPCEYNKAPRNLDDQIAGLASATGAIVISITGKMGHSTSGKIKRNCHTAGVHLIEIESAAMIASEMRDMASAGNKDCN